MVAEFEADLIRLRTREGMQVAKAKGRLRGKQPKLKPNQARHLLELHDLGTYQPRQTGATLRAPRRKLASSTISAHRTRRCQQTNRE
jgi:DNA invertase Pin-like site-specific DNA recombinase